MLRRAWILLLCLLASSLMATATVHAQENYGAASVSCEGAAHAEGDADQVPADGDQPFPHHHATCHGHGLSAAIALAAFPPVTRVRALPRAPGASALAERMVGPALEPPRS
ncbi:hypothetical protein P6144_02730 [Sphingomonas sp. HITSZ_GF]|uniref:hypothetical protein n=1 Tax=Sphingomonas sp. HITSZ_GF TaxID=3037247 RepID=UPI00240D2515|nr:hypothetical protein [Sphingomonas sp. HITSZ_GF]MDG2532550.1 hypothetical protein [Sphingomonas sp. HITSZ_GF]